MAHSTIGRTCIAAILLTVAVDLKADDPASSRTGWRIPDNPAAQPPIRWSTVKRSHGGVGLQAGIGRHHTYESAWQYYARRLGLKAKYVRAFKRRDGIPLGNGTKVYIREESRHNLWKTNSQYPHYREPRTADGGAVENKDRRTTMMGKVSGRDVVLYLWTEVENPDRNERVYIKMDLTPSS